MKIKRFRTIFHEWLCRYAVRDCIGYQEVGKDEREGIWQCENCGLIKTDVL